MRQAYFSNASSDGIFCSGGAGQITSCPFLTLPAACFLNKLNYITMLNLFYIDRRKNCME